MQRRTAKSAAVRGAVYGAVVAAIVATAFGAAPLEARAQAASQDTTVVDAREALRRKDGARLAQLRAQASAERNPLAMWVDYWELQNRIGAAAPAEAAAFMARWPATYVEDRFRNDWLLELGRRRDLDGLTAEFPRFRMNDDREVTCYVAVADQLAGRLSGNAAAKDAAIAAWSTQKDADNGCALLGQTLLDAKLISTADVWNRLRNATDANRIRLAKQTASLLDAATAAKVADALGSSAKFLAQKATAASRSDAEVATVALVRLAAGGSDTAAELLQQTWDKALPADLAAYAWASVAKQSALKLRADASAQFERAERAEGRRGAQGVVLPDDMLAWKARAALRADGGRPRWQQVMQAITAMTPAEQQDPQWLYWKARAAGAIAGAGDGAMLRTLRQELLASLAPQLNYYGQLAAEDLGAPQPLPPRAAPPTPAERDAAASNLGLQRALALIALGLRGEGVREWNYTLRGMGDRELLAAAQLACDRQVWDRCINTSDRTRGEIDLDQRFPTPHRREVVAEARDTGLDAAYVYGLIRQESRFIADARSGVGASGLMQLMPATARWTAKKIGLDYSHALIADRDVNLKLGNAYLKLVLDDVGGSQPMAAAAYNAGPGRPRKWREGATLEAAIWVENIPFAETRDYVKKVLSNAAYYASVMAPAAAGAPPAATKGTSVRARLGRAVGPPDPATPPADPNLP